MLLIEDAVGHGDRTSRVRLSLDVAEDLATLLVDPQHPWSLEVRVLEIAEERMDRGCPWTSPATDGIADTDGLIEIPTKGHFVVHATRPYPSSM